MKFKNKSIVIFLILLSANLFADKFVWNSKTGYPGVGRHRSSGIGIGKKVYYGLGHVSSGAVNVGFQDWWEYDPATNSWTQKANYPHQSHGAVGFTIGNKGYMGSGDSETIGAVTDFYEFDPVANTWTAKANCPLSNDGHVSFAINGIGYLGLGNSNQLYSYNPVSNMWNVATSSMPGSWHGAAFVLNNKAYYLPSYSNTLYMFDPATNTVTTKAPFIGVGRIAAAGFSVRGQGYIGLGTTAFDSPNDLKDFYFYDPTTNSWDTIPKSFAGARRHFVPCVTIGDNVYFGTGTNGTNLADFWAYEWKIAVGTNEYEKENSIQVFPNPAIDYININITESTFTPNLILKIYTIEGKELLSKKLEETDNKIDLSSYTKGVYFISMLKENEVFMAKKIIIN
jgi:N-acetylneuraminic acid mutarotase